MSARLENSMSSQENIMSSQENIMSSQENIMEETNSKSDMHGSDSESTSTTVDTNSSFLCINESDFCYSEPCEGDTASQHVNGNNSTSLSVSHTTITLDAGLEGCCQVKPSPDDNVDTQFSTDTPQTKLNQSERCGDEVYVDESTFQEAPVLNVDDKCSETSLNCDLSGDKIITRLTDIHMAKIQMLMILDGIIRKLLTERLAQLRKAVPTTQIARHSPDHQTRSALFELRPSCLVDETGLPIGTEENRHQCIPPSRIVRDKCDDSSPSTCKNTDDKTTNTPVTNILQERRLDSDIGKLELRKENIRSACSMSMKKSETYIPNCKMKLKDEQKRFAHDTDKRINRYEHIHDVQTCLDEIHNNCTQHDVKDKLEHKKTSSHDGRPQACLHRAGPGPRFSDFPANTADQCSSTKCIQTFFVAKNNKFSLKMNKPSRIPVMLKRKQKQVSSPTKNMHVQPPKERPFSNVKKKMSCGERILDRKHPPPVISNKDWEIQSSSLQARNLHKNYESVSISDGSEKEKCLSNTDDESKKVNHFINSTHHMYSKENRAFKNKFRLTKYNNCKSRDIIPRQTAEIPQSSKPRLSNNKKVRFVDSSHESPHSPGVITKKDWETKYLPLEAKHSRPQTGLNTGNGDRTIQGQRKSGENGLTQSERAKTCQLHHQSLEEACDNRNVTSDKPMCTLNQESDAGQKQDSSSTYTLDSNTQIDIGIESADNEYFPAKTVQEMVEQIEQFTKSGPVVTREVSRASNSNKENPSSRENSRCLCTSFKHAEVFPTKTDIKNTKSHFPSNKSELTKLQRNKCVTKLLQKHKQLSTGIKDSHTKNSMKTSVHNNMKTTGPSKKDITAVNKSQEFNRFGNHIQIFHSSKAQNSELAPSLIKTIAKSILQKKRKFINQNQQQYNGCRTSESRSNRIPSPPLATTHENITNTHTKARPRPSLIRIRISKVKARSPRPQDLRDVLKTNAPEDTLPTLHPKTSTISEPTCLDSCNKDETSKKYSISPWSSDATVPVVSSNWSPQCESNTKQPQIGNHELTDKHVINPTNADMCEQEPGSMNAHEQSQNMIKQNDNCLCASAYVRPDKIGTCTNKPGTVAKQSMMRKRLNSFIKDYWSSAESSDSITGDTTNSASGDIINGTNSASGDISRDANSASSDIFWDAKTNSVIDDIFSDAISDSVCTSARCMSRVESSPLETWSNACHTSSPLETWSNACHTLTVSQPHLTYLLKAILVATATIWCLRITLYLV